MGILVNATLFIFSFNHQKNRFFVFHFLNRLSKKGFFVSISESFFLFFVFYDYKSLLSLQTHSRNELFGSIVF